MKSRPERLVLVLLAVLLVAAGTLAWIAAPDSISPAVGAAAVSAAPTAYRTETEAEWVVDPRVPGDNLPPIGRSLFDFLVMEKQDGKLDYALPFPFTALMQRMEEHLRRDGEGPALKAVLIPLGRSLQRSAAAPEFFKYPRIVLTTDAEPADLYPAAKKSSAGGVAKEGNPGMLLKDRLYLGYQEKADLIEVISYNEAAARFEFQLVKDYRPGAKPKVFYANRALCIACHQNGGPIFSRQLWDETNANPKVAALLRGQRGDFYGIPDRGVDLPYAIDNATDRANLLAVQQLLWREGCGGTESAAARCRAGLFTALLQYRLTGRQQFDRTSAEYRDRVAARLAAQGGKRWPQGLAIGNPDLPNRDPLPGEQVSEQLLRAVSGNAATDAELRRQLGNLSNVAAAFEPLNARPALEVWSVAQPADAARAVIGLAEFIAQSDVVRLDSRLFALAGADSKRLSHRAACTVKQSGLGPRRSRVDFACDSHEEPALSIQGQLEIDGQRLTRGSLERLRLGRQDALLDMQLAAPQMQPSAGGGRAVLLPSRGGVHVRDAEGNAVEKIELAWSGSNGSADAIVVRDFAPVQEAVASMLRDQSADRFDGFAAKPMRRAVLMAELFFRLGMPAGRWCCLDDSAMPPPALEAPPRGSLSEAASATPPQTQGVRGFYRYCAQCHLTPERNPPNFLAGDAQRVGAQLAHCAPRIYVRLAMWSDNAESRAKTPMPPENALHGFNLSSTSWREGGELATLSAYVSELLRTETGKAPRLDELLADGYENLRPCLAERG
jgi:hypothetical protein